MAQRETAARVKRYLERRIAWFEELLADLDACVESPPETDWEAWLGRQQRRTEEMEDLAREHVGLLREWRASAEESPEQRQEVRMLAERAETTQGRILEAYTRACHNAAQRMEAGEAELAALRKGHELLGRYRAEGGPEHDFLDRKA
jgi:hypothetical protein